MGTHLHVICTGHPRVFPTFPRHPTLFTALSLHSGAENPAYISEGRVLSSWVKRQCSKVKSTRWEAQCRPHVNVFPIRCWKSCSYFSREDFQLLSKRYSCITCALPPSFQIFPRKKMPWIRGIRDFFKKKQKQIIYDHSMKMGYGYMYMYSYTEERICISVCPCVHKDFILDIFSWNRKEAPWGGVVLSCFCNYNFMIWLGVFWQ